MAELLSQEWLDGLVAAGDAFGGGTEGDPAGSVGPAVAQFVVNGAPGGPMSYWARYDGGRIVEAALGETEQADLTFTVAYEDLQRLDRGEVEPSAAYMQGRLKADGDMTKLFALLAASHAPRQPAG